MVKFESYFKSIYLNLVVIPAKMSRMELHWLPQSLETELNTRTRPH